MPNLSLTLDCDPANVLVTSPGQEAPYVLRATIHEPDAVVAEADPAAARRPDVDFCLLIDCSRSMWTVAAEVYVVTDRTALAEHGATPGKIVTGPDGENVPSVFDVCKEGAKAILAEIGSNDRVSIVTFGDRVERVVTNLSGSGDVAGARAAIDRLRPDGIETRMDLGLAEAAAVLGWPAAGRIGAILMLTDGNATLAEAALEEARKVAGQGITVNAYGIGESFNLALMQTLVTPSNGKTGALASPGGIRDTFINQFAAAKDVIASELELELYFDPRHVRLHEFYRGAPQNAFLGQRPSEAAGGGESRVVARIGNLEKRQRVEIFVKAEVVDLQEPASEWEFVRANLTYNLAAEARSSLSETATLAVPIVADALDHKNNGEIRKGFLLAETQKFQQERNALVSALRGMAAGPARDEARRRTIAISEAIMANFQAAGEIEAARNEAEYVEKLKAGGVLTDAELNRSSTSSSQPGGAIMMKAPNPLKGRGAAKR